MDNKYNNSAFYAIFLIIIGIFVIVAITLHFVFAGHKYTEYGTLGDAIGGITNPVIAIGAAILTFLAFRMQIDANRQVQDQFKLQQFESQFYEMLALHKDNINEMKIEGYEYDEEGKKQKKDTTGRKIFFTMNTELLCIYKIVKKNFIVHSNVNFTLDTETVKNMLSISYHVFFHGIERTENIFSKRKNLDKIYNIKLSEISLFFPYITFVLDKKELNVIDSINKNTHYKNTHYKNTKTINKLGNKSLNNDNIYIFNKQDNILLKNK